MSRASSAFAGSLGRDGIGVLPRSLDVAVPDVEWSVWMSAVVVVRAVDTLDRLDRLRHLGGWQLMRSNSCRFSCTNSRRSALCTGMPLDRRDRTSIEPPPE